MQDLKLHLSDEIRLSLTNRPEQPGTARIELQEGGKAIWDILETGDMRQMADWLNELIEESQEGG